MVTIVPIPAFTDNYIWAMYAAQNADARGPVVVVDPGDAAPVEKFLETNGFELAAILVTHHHGDHTGGIAALSKRWSPRVIAPRYSEITGATERVGEGDEIDLTAYGLPRFHVWHVPGHTLDHIAFVSDEILFCGDTMFAAGCGRLFEGTPAQMHESLSRLAALPPETRVYCTHEYTLANLAFATHVEPDNVAMAKRQFQVAEMRARNEPSLPTTIRDELETNPFLRAQSSSIRNELRMRGESLSDPADVFASLRRMKDSFRA
jgi:hydroxyacylglutathione hydrolase